MLILTSWWYCFRPKNRERTFYWGQMFTHLVFHANRRLCSERLPSLFVCSSSAKFRCASSIILKSSCSIGTISRYLDITYYFYSELCRENNVLLLNCRNRFRIVKLSAGFWTSVIGMLWQNCWCTIILSSVSINFSHILIITQYRVNNCRNIKNMALARILNTYYICISNCDYLIKFFPLDVSSCSHII